MGEVFNPKFVNTRRGFFCVCYACSNAGGDLTLSDECFGSCFPQVYFPLNWLNSAHRNLSPEIESLSESGRLIGLPTAGGSWWSSHQRKSWSGAQLPVSDLLPVWQWCCWQPCTAEAIPVRSRTLPMLWRCSEALWRMFHGTHMFPHGLCGMQRDAKTLLHKRRI